MISFKKDVELFRNLTCDIDTLISDRSCNNKLLSPSINIQPVHHSEFVYPNIENKDYPILDNMYTDLPDIMHVDKIKRKRF